MPDREQGVQEGAGGKAGAASFASQEAKAAGAALHADRLPMARWQKGAVPVKCRPSKATARLLAGVCSQPEANVRR